MILIYTSRPINRLSQIVLDDKINKENDEAKSSIHLEANFPNVGFSFYDLLACLVAIT